VPLDERSNINEDELRRCVDWLIDRGVHGLYPNGSRGEFRRYTADERKRIVMAELSPIQGVHLFWHPQSGYCCLVSTHKAQRRARPRAQSLRSSPAFSSISGAGIGGSRCVELFLLCTPCCPRFQTGRLTVAASSSVIFEASRCELGRRGSVSNCGFTNRNPRNIRSESFCR
jgi:hypothetical protein